MGVFKIENNKGIQVVTIHNPKKKNALNKAAYLELSEILDNAARDQSLKALVLTGSDDFFS
jgi:enoyl-CoA hydratase/carnithine racemase